MKLGGAYSLSRERSLIAAGGHQWADISGRTSVGGHQWADISGRISSGRIQQQGGALADRAAHCCAPTAIQLFSSLGDASASIRSTLRMP
jgi:hypothetical protein